MSRVKCHPLDELERVKFRVVCRDEGVDPKERCPLCRRKVSTAERQWRLDGPTNSWVPSSVYVRCARCRREWGVDDEVARSGRFRDGTGPGGPRG